MYNLSETEQIQLIISCAWYFSAANIINRINWDIVALKYIYIRICKSMVWNLSILIIEELEEKKKQGTLLEIDTRFTMK